MRVQESTDRQPDEVDRAISGVREAMIELASLLQADDGMVRVRVVEELRRMGWYAGGALAAAVSRATDRGLQVDMLGLIRKVGHAYDPDVVEVLEHLHAADPDELIASEALATLEFLRERQFNLEFAALVREIEQ